MNSSNIFIAGEHRLSDLSKVPLNTQENFNFNVIGGDYVRQIIDSQKGKTTPAKTTPVKTTPTKSATSPKSSVQKRKRSSSKKPKRTINNTTPGTREAHVRKVKGKLVQVRQSITKAGSKTAGQLRAIGSQGLQAGKKYGGQAIETGKKYGGQAVTLVKQNPKASAAIAAGGVAAGTIGYLSGRKKRERIN